MPKLTANIRIEASPRKREVYLVELDGIISSPTIKRFRALLAQPLQGGRDLVLDVRRVTYMNSSGLGEMVRLHDELSMRNLSLTLIRMNPEVGRLVEMLGLSQLIRIVPGLQEALEVIDAGFWSGPPTPRRTSRRIKCAFVPVKEEPRPKLPDARILLGFERDPHFTRFLSRCLVGKGGRVSAIRSRAEAERAMGEGRVDLAILESSLPESRAICADLKLTLGNGVGSVIFIYPSREDASSSASPFRVCEDEFVSEPFEVRELIALAQAEYERCHAESILFVQEANLEVLTGEEGVTEANDTLGKLISASALPREAADGFLYAVREAVDNARRHGNQSQSGKLIRVQYLLDREKITVTVGDEGRGFDADAALKRAQGATPIEQARQRHSGGGYGGLGLGLMLRCCDKVEYVPPGNILKLTKYL